MRTKAHGVEDSRAQNRSAYGTSLQPFPKSLSSPERTRADQNKNRRPREAGTTRKRTHDQSESGSMRAKKTKSDLSDWSDWALVTFAEDSESFSQAQGVKKKTAHDGQ